MGEILFLAHRMPFPPDRGDKIRSHHLLRALGQLAPVHVGCFGDTDADFEQEPVLAQHAASHCLVRRSKSMAVAGIEALVKGTPVSLTAFEHSGLHKWVTRLVRERDIRTIFVFSGQMAQHVPDDFDGQVIVDLCDVDSAKFEAYARDGRLPRRWIDAREGRLLSIEEERVSKRAAATLLVTEAEKELFRSRLANPSGHHLRAVRNGIDAAFFDPNTAEPLPDLAACEGRNLVFTGQMDYAPNVAAAHRVIDRLLPAIRAAHPNTTFHLVGRAPVASLTRRDGLDGVRVWGEVSDIRPFLAVADVVVAPLEIARGVQNKVLEAMAMARPVVLSDEAATGIDAVDGRDFSVGADDNALVANVLALLGDGPAALNMAASARRYVIENQSWEAMLASLPGICGFGNDEEVHRDVA